MRKNNLYGVLVFVILSVAILSFAAMIDYSFFRTIINLSTIFLALLIYIIAFYTKNYSRGSNLLFVGIAYLSVAMIDLMHVVNGGGFSIEHYDLNASTILWICARFTEAFVLYFAYSKLIKKGSIDFKLIFLGFGVSTLLIFGLSSLGEYMPIIYNPDTGFTGLKIVFDILIILMFISALVFISNNESRIYNRRVLIIAISLKILAELVFIFDTGDVASLGAIRYISKYVSYILLFLVFARDLLQRPYENIFRSFKQKEELLIELSRKDSLTGLYNHSMSYETIRELIKKNENAEEDLCLMMIDVDDFKNINDKYGHVKGDEILLRISRVFKTFDGPLKLAGRYGGDEFVVVFDDCNGGDAIRLANKMFEKMKELSTLVGFEVTLSVGIALWEKGFNATDLVQAADIQMYKSKTNGKSKFSIKAKSE